MRTAYQTDLSDAEWSYIVELNIPTPKVPGRPRVHSLREILNAIFYIVRSGCAWRLLPHDFPPWKTALITSGLGGSTAPGKGCTERCASECGYASGETLSQTPG
jgi:transposase